MEGYVSSMKRAMSENNVLPIDVKRSSKFKKFFASNMDDNHSVSDVSEYEGESIENNVLSLQDMHQRSTIRTHQHPSLTYLDGEGETDQNYNETFENPSSIKKSPRKYRSPVKKNFSTVQTNS